jgi:hypothetical protein
MKKKILSGVFALGLLATAGFGVNRSVDSDANLSDLALRNVEALAANGENTGDEKVSYPCKNPSDGVGCGYIGLTGPGCYTTRYC